MKNKRNILRKRERERRQEFSVKLNYFRKFKLILVYST